MNKAIQLYHHRSRKRFETYCDKKGIKYSFEGYCCGMYDPMYKVPLHANFWDCPVAVWLARITYKPNIYIQSTEQLETNKMLV